MFKGSKYLPDTPKECKLSLFLNVGFPSSALETMERKGKKGWSGRQGDTDLTLKGTSPHSKPIVEVYSQDCTANL
jgi:hypothetical protein